MSTSHMLLISLFAYPTCTAPAKFVQLDNVTCVEKCAYGYSQQTIYTVLYLLCVPEKNCTIPAARYVNTSIDPVQYQCEVSCPPDHIVSRINQTCVPSLNCFQITDNCSLLNGAIGCNFNSLICEDGGDLSKYCPIYYLMYLNDEQTQSIHWCYSAVCTTPSDALYGSMCVTPCDFFSLGLTGVDKYDHVKFLLKPNDGKPQTWDGVCVNTCLHGYRHALFNYSLDNGVMYGGWFYLHCVDQYQCEWPNTRYVNASTDAHNYLCEPVCPNADEYLYRVDQSCKNYCKFIGGTTVNNQVICEQFGDPINCPAVQMINGRGYCTTENSQITAIAVGIAVPMGVVLVVLIVIIVFLMRKTRMFGRTGVVYEGMSLK